MAIPALQLPATQPATLHGVNESPSTDARFNILVLEEDKNYGPMVAAMIEEERPGCRVDSVPRARLLVGEFAAKAYDAIVLELHVPDLGGVATVRAIRARFVDIPIVVVSRACSEEQAFSLVCAGAQECVLMSEATGQRLVRVLTFALHRTRAEIALRTMVHRDALTGLGNRRFLDDRIPRALARRRRRGGKLALLVLDLDRFKTINDSYGHQAGDELLVEVADRVRSCIRDTDTAIRSGGDEFILLLEDLDGAAGAERVAWKLLEAFSKPFRLTGQSVHCGASIGVAVYPEAGTCASVLERNADAAMYDAKRSGRNQFRMAGARNSDVFRIERTQELRLALERREFVVHFQPVLDLRRSHICGFEALVRWQPGGGELIGPNDFIPQAEKSGVVNHIGKFVLARSCEQWVRWGHELATDLWVSVNVSVNQLGDDGLVNWFDELCSRGMTPNAIQFELTETSLMHDFDRGIKTLGALRERGARIAIDDFGTGYCSLRYLRELPVSTVKIDRSFIEHLDVPVDAALTRGIIDLAHTLDLTVVAEGVETHAQLEKLTDYGVDEIQGYLLAPAMASADINLARLDAHAHSLVAA